MDLYSVPEHKKSDHRIQAMEKELRVKYEFDSIIGRHPTMVEILKSVSQVADTNATVLIQSESGTGKELIAQALHYNSSRKENPFIPINWPHTMRLQARTIICLVFELVERAVIRNWYLSGFKVLFP